MNDNPTPDQPHPFTDRETGKPVAVSHRGSLGLLALGEEGILAWKQAIRAHEQKGA